MPYQDQFFGSTANPTGSKKISDHINGFFGVSDYTLSGLIQPTTVAPANVDLTVRGSTRLQDLATGLFGAYAQSRGGAQESYEAMPVMYAEPESIQPVTIVAGALALGALIYFMTAK